MYMAKSRREKNKDLYDQLDKEMKNSKENSYEEKLKNLDPNLDASGDAIVPKEEYVIAKKNETKNSSSLTVIAKKVNGGTFEKKHEIVKVEKKKKKEEEIIDVEELNEPVSFTDKLSVESILRAKLEQQQKLKADKKSFKKSPNDEKYTPAMMQERIKQHEGIDVRKEVNLKHNDHRKLVLGILILSLIAVVVIGALLIFRVI